MEIRAVVDQRTRSELLTAIEVTDGLRYDATAWPLFVRGGRRLQLVAGSVLRGLVS